jgi:starvation-inducible DNA-binding protein
MGHNHNDGHNLKQQILIQPNIGLDSDVRLAVLEMLNNTLANEIVLAQKTRSARWNVSGSSFFEMSTLFDTQYKQLSQISDEIAERSRMLGGVILGSIHEMIQASRLEEHPGLVADILHLLADQEACIRYVREDARKCAIEYEDEGTFNMLVDILRKHEKMAWILRSYIENEPVRGESQKRVLFNE